MERIVGRLETKIDKFMEYQQSMMEEIKSIKLALYDPDDGIYARLAPLVKWKNNANKIMWVLITASMTSTIGIVWSLLISYSKTRG